MSARRPNNGNTLDLPSTSARYGQYWGTSIVLYMNIGAAELGPGTGEEDTVTGAYSWCTTKPSLNTWKTDWHAIRPGDEKVTVGSMARRGRGSWEHTPASGMGSEQDVQLEQGDNTLMYT